MKSIAEYCIAVSNAGGSASATNVTVNDPVPTELTYNASSIIVNGTVDANGNCQTDGATGGSYTGTTVSATIPTTAAGETRTVRCRATIN